MDNMSFLLGFKTQRFLKADVSELKNCEKDRVSVDTKSGCREYTACGPIVFKKIGNWERPVEKLINYLYRNGIWSESPSDGRLKRLWRLKAQTTINGSIFEIALDWSKPTTMGLVEFDRMMKILVNDFLKIQFLDITPNPTPKSENTVLRLRLEILTYNDDLRVIPQENLFPLI